MVKQGALHVALNTSGYNAKKRTKGKKEKGWRRGGWCVLLIHHGTKVCPSKEERNSTSNPIILHVLACTHASCS